MNVNLSTTQISTQNISWLEQKANNIMRGNFTKLSYISPDFTMNGIYLQFPIHVSNLDIIDNKAQMKFNPNSSLNQYIVKEFAKIENRLLDNYIQTRQHNLKKVILLAKQLYSGFMKIYKETYGNFIESNDKYFYVKISGVWETDDTCGLTYKLYGGLNLSN